jgi:quinol-cytochrome oxidoreductase complex cytochrome b subunit/mono/diheme cytochrome c family protein
MENALEPTRPAGFLEARTRWSLLKQVLLLERLPGGSRWAAAFGSLLLFSFVVQVVTGVLLAVNYAPSAESAWPSVNYIQQKVPIGSFIRAVHHWGSSAMVILLLLHLAQVFIWGAYKKPREFTWMTGVLLLVCTLGLAFTGYLLPWDQKAYWATKVGLGIASTVPVIGDDLRTFLQGGPELGNLTLTRFFTLHALLLPGLLIGLVIVHLYFFRVHGVTPPWWVSKTKLKAQEEPFWPKQAFKDAILALAFLVGLGLWAYYRSAPLEAPADPSQPYEARPEWYFMFLFQFLRYFDGSTFWRQEVVGTFILPLLFFLCLFFWPFIDRNPHRDPRRRPLAISLFGLGTLGLVGLTIYAVATDVRMKEPTTSVEKTPPSEPAGPIQRADVARVFATHCAACHGVDGSAARTRAAMPTIPDFTSLAWQMTQTELEITHRIQDGQEPLMPAYRDKLSAREILALTIYVRAFRPESTDFVAPRPAQPTPPPDASHMSLPQVYRAYCLACHDADGRGKTVKVPMPEIPDFTDLKWNALRTDADLKHSILEGKGKFMLPMKDKLSAADAEKMVGYLRQFRQGKQIVDVTPPRPVEPPPVTPVEVPKKELPPEPATVTDRTRAATVLYRQYCLTCHSTDGRGRELRPSIPELPDFTSREWQQRHAAPQLAASVLDGKGTLMPAFRGRVTEDQARDLAAYVRAFGPEVPKQPYVPAGEFEKQFRELEDKWNALQKQLKEMQGPPPKR